MATKEMVGSHSDGHYLHGAEVKNWRQAMGGGGVVGHTITLTVTELNRVIAVPAFTAYVPDGSGGNTLVSYAGGNISVTAADGVAPRMDLLTLDASGNVGMVDGAATAETGLVAEAPTATLDDDEILLAVVRSPAAQANVLAADIRGRAIDVSETVRAIDTQTFSGSGTWTKPSKGFLVLVRMYGGGGKGGGGNGGAAGTNRYGGGGGGGGQCEERIFLASDLAATVAVTIGAGGSTGGTGGSSGNGANGSVGGDTTFGTHATAKGGGIGPGGTTSAAAGGAGGGIANTASTAGAGTGGGRVAPLGNQGFDTRIGDWSGGAGGQSVQAATAGDGGGAVSGSGGGGGGGMVDSSNNHFAGGAGGASNSYVIGGGGAAGALGAGVGSPGGAAALRGGKGGGGGGGNSAGTGGAGGAGGARGGGGGGGGGGTTVGGASGNGGAGFVEVITF